jgi:Acyl-CoA dehydrogenases
LKNDFAYEESEMKKTIRRFTRNELLPLHRKIDEEGDLSGRIREKFLSLGILKSAFPEEYGGEGGRLINMMMALKELAYASTVPSLMLLENFLLAFPILHYGSDYLKKTCIPDLIFLKSIGALAFTETDTGSDPKQLKTVAGKVDGGWIINGAKRFITYSGICDAMILFAKTGASVTAFLVEPKNKGYRVGRREKFIHTSSIDNGDLYLEDYFASDDSVIGNIGQGFEILLRTEAVGKIGFSAIYIGVAERAVDLSIQYANKKTHRGKPIGHKFQMIQVKLAEMTTMLAAMNSYLYQTCTTMDRGEDIFAGSAVLKLMVGENIKKIASDAMEIHGAYGLTEEFDISDLFRTAISAQSIMGSLDVQRVIIARAVLERGVFE